MLNSSSPIQELLEQPNFRVYFGLQQTVLMEKARTQFGQIFTRFDIPIELRLFGKFSLFTNLITTLIRQSLASYPVASANRLVFVTADYFQAYLTIRITDGGSGLRYQNRQLLRDSSATNNEVKSLSQLERLVKTYFQGEVEIHTFASRGTQVTLKLPVPTYNRNLDKS